MRWRSTSTRSAGSISTISPSCRARRRRKSSTSLATAFSRRPPASGRPDDEYLSGNVLEKLEEAQGPRRPSPSSSAMSTRWWRCSRRRCLLQHHGQARRALVEAGDGAAVRRRGSRLAGTPITYEPATRTVAPSKGAKQQYRRSATDDFGTDRRSPLELLDAVLNNRTIKITDKDEKKKDIPNEDQKTAAANEKAKLIRERFRRGCGRTRRGRPNMSRSTTAPTTTSRRASLTATHLTLPGLSAGSSLYPHVKRAVWRIIQTGNTYLAHAVGAGQDVRDDRRRHGAAPPRADQEADVCRAEPHAQAIQPRVPRAYPAANIMVADEQAFHTGNRRRFLAQAALNDPDAIIITHSSVRQDRASSEMRAQGLSTTWWPSSKARGRRRAATRRGTLVSQIEKQIEQLKRRFEGKKGRQGQAADLRRDGRRPPLHRRSPRVP
jgi:hypothetical protein